MPSLQSLRRKIAACKNTQKITKAMKMVAAAKLKRSQDHILAARPCALKMRGVLSNLSQRVIVGKLFPVDAAAEFGTAQHGTQDYC
jgi:F-type H+-transporting ATPase subunit gamma